jgi:hypothetical protein
VSKCTIGSAAFALPWAVGEEMARYKGYDYTQTVMTPVSLENQLLPGTLEFAIQVLVEQRVDTSIFGSRYKNDAMGCPAYDPKILLKIIVLYSIVGRLVWHLVSCLRCDDLERL